MRQRWSQWFVCIRREVEGGGWSDEVSRGNDSARRREGWNTKKRLARYIGACFGDIRSR